MIASCVNVEDGLDLCKFTSSNIFTSAFNIYVCCMGSMVWNCIVTVKVLIS